MDFIDRANRDKKPFLAWFNSTRMHTWTRLKSECQGRFRTRPLPGRGQVRQLLKKLDDPGNRQQHHRYLYDR